MMYVMHFYASLQLYVISVATRLPISYILCGNDSQNIVLLDTNACLKNVFITTEDVSVDLLYIWLEILFMVIACTNILRCVIKNIL